MASKQPQTPTFFSGNFLSNKGSNIKIELPILCENLNVTSNGSISFIQNMIISTWGALDNNITFSTTYNLILNSYTLNEDSEGNDFYQATVNQVFTTTCTDLFYTSPSRNNVGIEIYPKYNHLGKRLEGNNGLVQIPLLLQSKEDKIIYIPDNVQIFWSILIIG
jgi:hypothetical protein